jgi:hypothetical protein
MDQYKKSMFDALHREMQNIQAYRSKNGNTYPHGYQDVIFASVLNLQDIVNELLQAQAAPTGATGAIGGQPATTGPQGGGAGQPPSPGSQSQQNWSITPQQDSPKQ